MMYEYHLRQSKGIFLMSFQFALALWIALSLSASSIEAAVGWTTIFKQRKRKLPRDPLPDHRAVFEAIAEGDPDGARAAMSRLLELALEDTTVSLNH